MNCMIQLNEIFCYDCGINMRMKAASVLAMYSRDPFIAVTTIFTTTGNYQQTSVWKNNCKWYTASLNYILNRVSFVPPVLNRYSAVPSSSSE